MIKCNTVDSTELFQARMIINPNVLISLVGNDVVRNEATERRKGREMERRKKGKERWKEGKKGKEERRKGKPVVNIYSVKESFATLSEHLLVFVGNVIPSPCKHVKGRMILFTGK